VSPDLPGGTVTFVFTDIEGSSRVFRRLGKGYVGLLERHRGLLREVWEPHGGREVETQGDAFFVAFADPAAALQACVAAQEALRSEPWPEGATIRVRIGIHAGLAYPRGNGYVAFAVHQAARVVSAAHGGQVLVTAPTVSAGAPPAGVRLQSLGHYRLRDFDDAVELLQVDGLRPSEHFPAPRAVPADGHNLVRRRTAFIGRHSDLAELEQLVQASRLVTVAGVGGLGKTRLVTEWGLTFASGWPDGIWIIDLSAVGEPLLIPAAVADAVGIALASPDDPWEEVVRELASSRAVLIFDNCEHLTAAVADRVDDLLDRCPKLTVVATSREPLGLGDEHVCRLEPLNAEHDGVQLFIDRARSARHGLRLEGDEEVIATICRHLDGLPLAIELAAAQTVHLGVRAILAGLDQQRLSMRNRDRNVPERQRTMQALLDWSWRLLDVDERAGLAAISVFAGSFDLDTATVAIAADQQAAADTVWSLIDKSLIVADLTANETRYRCLNSIRAYARCRLDEVGQSALVGGRVARRFLARFGPQLDRIDQQRVYERAVEVDNLRGLISILAASDQETAQALACTIIDQAAYVSSALDEGLAYLALLPMDSVNRLCLLTRCATQANNAGNPTFAETLLDEAVALRVALGGEAAWDDVALDHQLGIAAIIRGDSQAALEVAERAAAHATTARGRSRAFNLHALVESEFGEPARAQKWFQLSLETDLEMGDINRAMIDYNNLAENALRAGDGSAAAQHQRHALGIAQQLGSELVIAFSGIVSARLAATTGRWADATRLHAHGIITLERLNCPLYPGDQASSDRFLEEAQAALGPDAFTRLHADGESFAMTDAVALADDILTAESSSS